MRAEAYGLIGLALLIAAVACDDEVTSVHPDQEPPEVVSTSPLDGAFGVDELTVIEVLFSEPVVLDSLAASPLRLESGGSAFEGDVALDSTETRLTLTPDEPLSGGTDYTAVLAAGIADQSGNVRSDSLVIRFSTGLAFHDLGRIYTANEISQDISVIDILTYEEVDGSPVVLGVAPYRLRAVPEERALYVLYHSLTDAGLLVIDAESLAVLRDTGPVLDHGVTDLAVSTDDGLVFIGSPGINGMLILDSVTLTPAREPLVFDRLDAQPNRLEITPRFDWLLVGLDGGARLAAYRLPGLEPVDGFPVSVVEQIHTIAIEDERGRAWVGGSQRFAVVDLINPERTISWQIPEMPCTGSCPRRLWHLLLSPVYDRVYFMNRRQSLASVVLSTLEPAPESPGRLRLNLFITELAQNPRTGDLIVLGWRNSETPAYRVDPNSLDQQGWTLLRVGDKAVDMELMP